MDDTFATTSALKVGREWIIHSNPNGEEVRL
jgi:hypothetical protein